MNNIFKGYEEYLREEYLNLENYIDDNTSYENFHDNFFASKSRKPKKFLFLPSTSSYQDRISEFKHHHITHVLIVIPQAFMKKIIADKRRINASLSPSEITKTFVQKFTQTLEASGIHSSFILHGAPNTRNDVNTKHLGRWLNLSNLSQELKLNDNKGFLLEFKDMAITTDNINDAIAINMGEESIALGANCSMLIGHDSTFFNYAITLPDGIVKISNIKNEKKHEVNFITQGITSITSQHVPLHDEYLQDGFFDNFSVVFNDIQQEDIKIFFDETPIILSSQIFEDTTSNEETKKTIINDRNSYLVNLKCINIPFEDNLLEVHYHVIKLGSKLLLVGGSNVPKGIHPLAKVIANIQEHRFTLTNLSQAPITFEIVKNEAKYIKPTKVRNQNKFAMHTDYGTESTDPSAKKDTIDIKPGISQHFSQNIDFGDSSISFSDNCIEISYPNFTIGSFNEKLELGRYFLKYFQKGNIIDASEDDKHQGKIYKDGSKKLVGASISRTPLTLTIKGDMVTLSNTINKHFFIHLDNHDDISQSKQLKFNENNITLSIDDFFSSDYSLSIFNTKKVKLIEFTIIPPNH